MAEKKKNKIVQGAPPVVFPFKTESYEILESPAEIKKWEKMLKERVGFKADISNLSGTCTESSSLGKTDDCDQD